MKQSKTTLFIGMLLAIIALVFVVQGVRIEGKPYYKINTPTTVDSEIKSVVNTSIYVIKDFFQSR